MHSFRYQLKILLRNRSSVFWSIIFPLILGTLFHLALSNLANNDNFDIVNIAVVEEVTDENFNSFINELSKENDSNQLFNTQYVSLDEAEELLKNEKITGYLIVSDQIEIVVNTSGINQTIMQSVVNSYLQTSSAYHNIYQINPQAFINGVLEQVSLDTDHFKDATNGDTNFTVVYFYTLIGMACMYGGDWGLRITTLTEANLSRQATRITVSPTSKFKSLVSGLFAGFICQFVSIFILFLYLVYGLNVSFGDNTNYIVLLMFVGSIVGISFGIFVGTMLKTKLATKNATITAVSMLFSFFAGMMVIDMKYLVLEYFPLAAYLNPVSLITDALYSLYYYSTLDRYFTNIVYLLLIALFFGGSSLIMMRRKKYDSI